MTHRRGLWAEMLPLEDLRDPAAHRLLARFGCDLAIAVRPGDIGRIAPAFRAASEAGVRASVWPMLDDAQGRWLSPDNAAVFAPFAEQALAESGAMDLVLDVEPLYASVRGALDGDRKAMKSLFRPVFTPSASHAGQEALRGLLEHAARAGVRVTAAVVPFLLCDAADSGPFGRMFGAPPAGAAAVNVMLYSTLFSGYSRGFLQRADARALLSAGAASAVRRWPARVHVSLGAVGVGALGDEAVYPDPSLLADDVALAAAAGARSLWLLDLGGVLQRGAPERWLRAFTAPPAHQERPRLTAKAGAAALSLAGLGRAIELFVSPRPARQ